MVVKWEPALQNEVTPNFPLHKDGYEWIHAEYIDGTRKDIHLRQAFDEAHLIKKISLDDAVSTTSLYRIMISIAYRLLDDADYATDEEDWFSFKQELLENNHGFLKNKIQQYFDTFEDRFYLIHPQYPFMQDASLYNTFSKDAFNAEDDDSLRKLTQKAVSDISTIDPNQPGTNKEDGAKTIWGLPKPEIYDVDNTVNQRLSLLMTALLYNFYSHSATNRGTKIYYNSIDPKSNDAYHKAHFFRTAVNYIPQADNLYQTLIVAMKYLDQEDIEKDLPIWETSPNEQGHLWFYGYNFPINEITYTYDAPRSSVNSTHLSILFFPEKDGVDGGQVKQMRRVLTNVKFLDNGSERFSFPKSWNPFVAIKEDTQKALKQIKYISAKTSMGEGTLYKIPLYSEINNISKPYALEEYGDYREIFNKDNWYVNVHVYAGDASQDKSFANLSFVENNLTHLTQDPIQRERLDSWFNVATNSKYTGLKDRLVYYVKLTLANGDKTKVKDSMGKSVDVLFWTMYTELYNQNVTPEGIKPVGTSEIKEYLKQEIIEIYNSQTGWVMQTNPVVYTECKRMLLTSFNKIMEGKNL